MLLNNIPVLDKGFVAPLEFSGNSRLLQDIQDTYFKAKVNMELLTLSSATLVIKCPLFVQLNLSKYNFDIISTPSNEIEAYIPDVSMINGDVTLQQKQAVANYMKQTTEALLINQKGFYMDGIDQFTSQLTMPITLYNEIIVKGSLLEWLRYLRQNKLPKELEQYRCQIENILQTQWKNIKVLLNSAI